MNKTQQKLFDTIRELEKFGIWIDEITANKKGLKDLKEIKLGRENSSLSYTQFKKRGKIMDIFVNELKKAEKEENKK